MQYNTMQTKALNKIQYNTNQSTQYNTIQSTQYNTIQYNAVKYKSQNTIHNKHQIPTCFIPKNVWVWLLSWDFILWFVFCCILLSSFVGLYIECS